MTNAIIELQKKIGAKVDGDFGPATLKAAAKHYKLTNEQAAHFFGQCAHETGEFQLFVENLNYSAEGLRKIFGKYFTAEQAAQYARKPEAIASRVYANRMGNGTEDTKDGWKYRGRGAIQLTGKFNYKAFAATVKTENIMVAPDRVATVYAFESALFFFNNNNLWPLCQAVDEESITAVTKRVNGGTNGMAHRVKLTRKFYGWLTQK
jgi:putative chitinase